MARKNETPQNDAAGIFVYQGKKYQVLGHSWHIPGIGELTTLEICVHEDAQRYLVENNTLGTVIEEVLE